MDEDAEVVDWLVAMEGLRQELEHKADDVRWCNRLRVMGGR